jgi:hypothetical protein
MVKILPEVDHGLSREVGRQHRIILQGQRIEEANAARELFDDVFGVELAALQALLAKLFEVVLDGFLQIL